MAGNGTTQMGRGLFRARKVMAACLGGVLLFCSGHACADETPGLWREKLEEKITAPQVSGRVATCTLNGAGSMNASPEAENIVISKGNLTATLNCNGEGNAAVPSKEGHVCRPGATTLPKCETNSGHTEQVELAKLLGSSSVINVKIDKRPAATDQTNEKWTLELKDSQLPLSDKSFFVGCQKPQHEADTTCKVEVVVKARSSSVDSNAVTCAYGPQSNGATPLTVEMTEETNKLAVDCGNEGSFAPLGYTQFCSPESQELKTCQTKEFSEIFPTFADTWWQKADQMKTVAELTIPKTDFPSEERQFLLGCVPMAASQENEGKDTVREAARGALAGLSECKVLVTVKAASSSAAPADSLHVILAGLGAVALLLVRGC
ncbi:SAG-related sequence SRS16E [Besnoitia besnoiti]|uniref:SAG-related sequence SRS16E n=1 Tax=Besnoitia besnoiti TaxID=94643 RepID=A0A2A9MCG3_BESBE|nr:SAG-related sequence SRS16E [Besnoitia besnoiti]PFH36178.1 SAG-related sequence SRS16E [Besnoitia besnoiti]